ncbi:O-antigen ligase family protein [Vibrio vulnificus]|nr:O-antigen ligase family protein [Vibrio vulnificus]EJA3292932.1 O-antigen ligase family protein [Vibrio vulnificus]
MKQLMDTSERLYQENESALELHLYAVAVILYFVSLRTQIAGVTVTIADMIGLASIGFLLLIILKGRMSMETVRVAGVNVIFIGYIALNGIINDVGMKNIIVEVIQWSSIVAFLCVLHFLNLFKSKRFLSLVALYAFYAAVYTALWHVVVIGDFQNFKHLHNAKYLFGFSTVMLYLFRSQIKNSHILLFIAFVLLILSGERKAMLGVLLVLFIDHFFVRGENTKMTHVVMSLAAAFGVISVWAGIYYFGTDWIAESLFLTQNDIYNADLHEARWDSELWRRLLLANGFSLFMDHFYFGVGPKMLLSYIAPYFVGNEELIVYTHNMLLDIAVEYGIIGVALLFGGVLVRLAKAFKTRGQNSIPFLLCIYTLSTALFAATQSTVILMFMLPFFIDVRLPRSSSEERENKA